MTENDGGPAFPCSSPASEDGLSLRDYFAAQALAGLIHHYQSDEAISSDPLPDLSRTAYDYADAMLKARQS